MRDALKLLPESERGIRSPEHTVSVEGRIFTQLTFMQNVSGLETVNVCYFYHGMLIPFNKGSHSGDEFVNGNDEIITQNNALTILKRYVKTNSFRKLIGLPIEEIKVEIQKKKPKKKTGEIFFC